MIDGDDNTYSLPASEVMHLKAGEQSLWPLLNQLADEYEQLMSVAADGYTKQAGEHGILKISSSQSGTPEEQKARIRQLSERFREYFSATNAVIPLYSGYDYESHSSAHRNTSEMNDLINLSDEWAEKLSLAVGVPAALLKGNAENTENAQKELILYGIKPLALQIEQEYNFRRYTALQLRKGSKLYIDPITIQLSDATALANFCERMTSCGQHSIDELRQMRGEPLLGTPEAQKHWITKNYGYLGSEDITEQSTEPEQEPQEE